MSIFWPSAYFSGEIIYRGGDISTKICPINVRVEWSLLNHLKGRRILLSKLCGRRKSLMGDSDRHGFMLKKHAANVLHWFSPRPIGAS